MIQEEKYMQSGDCLTTRLFLRTIRIGLYLGLVFLLGSCSLTRTVPKGEYLLRRVRVSSTDRTAKLPPHLSDALRQRPNAEVLGFIPVPLYIYNWSRPGGNRWIDRQLRKIGEEPVLYDSTETARSVQELALVLESEGYWGSHCSVSGDTIGAQKVCVNYRLSPGSVYYIDSLSYQIADTAIRRMIDQSVGRKLHYPAVGKILAPRLLDEARRLVVASLADKGYWGFSPEQIRYEADTTMARGGAVALRMIVDNRDALPYRFGSVSVWENTTPKNNISPPKHDESERGQGRDPAGILFKPDGTAKFTIRPITLSRNIFIRSGELYSTEAVDRTYAALVSLPILRNASIKFSPDSLIRYDSLGRAYRLLQTDILTMTDKPKQISAELVGTNSAGDMGAAATIGFLHRNLFGGSELLGIKLRGGCEAIRRGEYSFLEYGVEASLRFPRIVFPFLSEKLRSKYKASTDLTLAYNYQTRPEFSRRILSGRWAYNVRAYRPDAPRHRFKLIDVDYLHLPFIDPEFRRLLPPSAELYNYTDQFIVGSGYSYTLTNNNDITQRRDAYLIRLSVELAGNLLQGISAMTHASKDQYGSYSLFGINYAQFVKLDAELSRSYLLSKRSSIALHLALGAAYPYGNAERVPFEFRYFGGGANGVRGWGIRSLGPGAMPRGSNRTIFYRVGDLSLIMNAEYRASLFWRFQLAGYVDAGNIWTLRSYESQPQGLFRLHSFYREIAVSYGLGLRLDFDYFVVRFDTGVKAYDPGQPIGERMRIGERNLSDRFAWHFAIGYPF